jgi:hypothetical protein
MGGNDPPKLITLCYAHADPLQPQQLPDYTLMYAHIGRHTHVLTHWTSSDPVYLALSLRYVYLYIENEKKDVAISGIRAKKELSG